MPSTRHLAPLALFVIACGSAPKPAPPEPAAPPVGPVGPDGPGGPGDPVGPDGPVGEVDAAHRVTVVPVAGVTSLSLGEAHACVVRDDGRILCWGDGSSYRLGTGRRDATKTPTLVPSVDHAVKVAAGGTMSCALKDDGSVACWGGYRQIPGDEDGFAWPLNRLPVTVSTPPTWVVEVSVGWTQAVLRDAAGGVAILDAYLGPVPLPKFAPAVGLAALSEGFCALTAAGQVECVTSSESGAGGDGGGDVGYGEDPGQVLAPVVIDDAVRASLVDADGNDLWSPCATWDEHRVVPPYCARTMSTAVRIDAQGELGCAVQRDGTLACWGCADCWDEHRPDLGLPREIRFLPASMPGVKDVVEVAVGGRHLCTLHKGGAVRCWGDDSQGQLGPLGKGPSSTPIDVPGLGDVMHIEAATATTCALRRDRTVACWGHTLGTPFAWPSHDEDAAEPPAKPADRAAPIAGGAPAPRADLACVAVDVFAADGELFETRYGYDAQGRTTREQSFAWREGKAVEREDTVFQLDRAGNTTHERHVEQRADGPYAWSVRYRYDKAGNAIWKKAEGAIDDSAYTWAWDARGRFVGGTTVMGRRATLAWHDRPAPPPFEGLTLSEADNEEDELFGFDTLTVGIVRDAAGRVVYTRDIASEERASDTTTTYDAEGRVTVERVLDYQVPFFEDPDAVTETRYTYDPSGRLATTEVWDIAVGDGGKATLTRRTVHLGLGCL